MRAAVRAIVGLDSAVSAQARDDEVCNLLDESVQVLIHCLTCDCSPLDLAFVADTENTQAVPSG